MASRSSRRRRALVAPFVVTIAAAPACGGPGPAGGASEPGGTGGTTAGPGDVGYDANPPQPRPTGAGRWVDKGDDIWHFVFDDGRVARKDAGASYCFVYPRAECLGEESVPDCHGRFVECPLGAADAPSPWGAPPAPPTELPPDDE